MVSRGHVAPAGRFPSLPAWLAQAPSFLVLQFFCQAQLATRALTMPLGSQLRGSKALSRFATMAPLKARETPTGKPPGITLPKWPTKMAVKAPTLIQTVISHATKQTHDVFARQIATI
jgi:hypothetical protein